MRHFFYQQQGESYRTQEFITFLLTSKEKLEEVVVSSVS